MLILFFIILSVLKQAFCTSTHLLSKFSRFMKNIRAERTPEIARNEQIVENIILKSFFFSIRQCYICMYSCSQLLFQRENRKGLTDRVIYNVFLFALSIYQRRQNPVQLYICTIMNDYKLFYMNVKESRALRVKIIPKNPHVLDRYQKVIIILRRKGCYISTYFYCKFKHILIYKR